MARRGVLVAGAVAAVAAGEVALAVDGASAVVVLTDALAASTFLGVAIVAWRRRQNALAAAAGGAGLAWLAGNVVSGIAPLHRPVLVGAALIAGDARLRRATTRAVLAAAWLVAIAAPNRAAANVAVGALVVAVGVYTYVRASIAFRPWAAVVTRSTAALGIALAAPSLFRLVDPVSHNADLVLAGYATLVAVAGGLLFVGLLVAGPGGSDAVNSVIELTETGSRDVDDVIAALRRGDAEASSPDVELALAEVADLLAENRALHAALEAQVDEVHRSRRRLVDAADVERRRLARRLAEGAGQHLNELETTFGVLAGVSVDGSTDIVDRVTEELAATRDDLEQLASGLHPRVLVEEGLRASLTDLARRAVIPTEISAPDARFAASVETTIWYVCAEAAANVAKHAQARAMTIGVTVEAGQVVATIADDGVGGADTAGGSGLAGLADRLDAVGGGIELRSAPGHGTEVRAWVPVA